jgi:hypothetical protein
MFQNFPLGIPFYFLPNKPIQPTPSPRPSVRMHARWRQEVVETAALRVVASTFNPSSSSFA